MEGKYHQIQRTAQLEALRKLEGGAITRRATLFDKDSGTTIFFQEKTGS